MSVKKKSRKKASQKKSGKVHKLPVGESRQQFEVEPDEGMKDKKLKKKPDFNKKDKKLSPQRKASGPEKKRRRAVGRSASSESISTIITPPVVPNQVDIKPKRRKSKKDS